MRHALFVGAVLGLASGFPVQPAAASSPTSTAAPGLSTSTSPTSTVSVPSAVGPTSTPVPGISAAGDAIARAADGSMWLTEPSSPGRVARVTPTGSVTEYVAGVTPNFTASRSPDGIAITPDGYVWFLMHGGSDEIGRISMDTGAAYRFTLTGAKPTSIAAGSDGKLWMTANGDSGGTDLIARFSRVDGTTQIYSAGLTSQTEPRSLTTNPDGTLSFVEGSSSGRIGRITSDGTITLRSVGGAPTALGVGPRGSLWFSRGSDLGLVGADAATLFPTDTTPAAVAAGPDDAVWSAANGGIVRVAPDGSVTTYAAGLNGSARGIGLAAGPDARMWMTLDRAPYLVRITVPPRVGSPTTTASSATTGTVTTDVTPNGLATVAALQLRTAAGAWVTLNQAAVGDGTDAAPVRFDLDHLAAATKHTLRIVATNAAGTATSLVTDLTTAASAAATAGPVATTPITAGPAAPVAEPAPVQGSTVVLRPARGTVQYRVPGSSTVRDVDGAASIPTGSVIDASNGAVILSSRVNGAEQQGRFYGGEFRVKQVKATGMTQLFLTAELDCSAPGRRATQFAAKKKRRHVWGKDSNGRFETHGQDSVATVRGTRWLTTDTCAGTTVSVFEGAVSVKPRRGAGKAVLVRAGGRHFTPHGA